MAGAAGGARLSSQPRRPAPRSRRRCGGAAAQWSTRATRGYRQSWFQLSFLDLREDFAEANAGGKRLAVLFAQRGCAYCASMHNGVLAAKYINETCARTSRSCSSTCGVRAK